MKPRFLPSFALTGALLWPALLPAETTINSTAKYAHAANAGWVNFAANGSDGVVFGGYYLAGYAHAANFGWIHFGDASPSNGIRYQNNSATDYGVNHDGLGNLGGYAYAANVGWINFGWATAADANRPRVNLATGAFAGYAYGANIGWINLATGLSTDRMDITDSDGDGIADQWERTHFGNLTTANAISDKDKDGVTDFKEYLADTDPNNPASYLRIVSQSYNGTYTEATLEFTSTPSRLYRIEFSNNLDNPWTNSSLGTFAPNAGPTTTRTITYPGNPRKFFRAVAVLPLAP